MKPFGFVAMAIALMTLASCGSPEPQQIEEGGAADSARRGPDQTTKSEQPSREEIERDLAESFLAEHRLAFPGNAITDYGCDLMGSRPESSSGKVDEEISCWVRGPAFPPAGIENWIGAYADLGDRRYCWSLLAPLNPTKLTGCTAWPETAADPSSDDSAVEGVPTDDAPASADTDDIPDGEPGNPAECGQVNGDLVQTVLIGCDTARELAEAVTAASDCQPPGGGDEASCKVEDYNCVMLANIDPTNPWSVTCSTSTDVFANDDAPYVKFYVPPPG